MSSALIIGINDKLTLQRPAELGNGDRPLRRIIKDQIGWGRYILKLG